MPIYYSPEGNPEVWGSKPSNYLTVDEWDALHPIPLPPELTIAEKIRGIQEKYKPLLDELISACSAAQMLGEEEDADKIKSEYSNLLHQQSEEILTIQNGGF